MSIQQTIIKGIKEQLFFNDYLVLPNFGGFVLKSRPAHFSASGGMLVPPSKTVSFNAKLKQNDGILATWLQNTLKCSAKEGITHLTEFSEFCSGILAAKRRVSLEAIGFFYLDFENNICFEPQQDANFLTRSFGLGAMSIKELESTPEIREPKKEILFVDRTLHATEPTAQPVRSRKNYNRLVTPLLVAILCVSLLGLLVNNSSVNGELRSSLFSGKTKGVYEPVTYSNLNIVGSSSKQSAYVADANGIASLELGDTKKIAVKVLDNRFDSSYLNTSRPNSGSFSNSGNFEIVLGCFTILENAKRMVEKLGAQRMKAAVTGKNNKGMYVVSNGNYSSKDEAIARLQEIKDAFPHAWIKKD